MYLPPTEDHSLKRLTTEQTLSHYMSHQQFIRQARIPHTTPVVLAVGVFARPIKGLRQAKPVKSGPTIKLQGNFVTDSLQGCSY